MDRSVFSCSRVMMQTLYRAAWPILLLCLLLLWATGAAAQERDGQDELSSSPPVIFVLQVKDAISPASADFIARAIRQAEEQEAEAVLLQLDTPGGLLASMRDVIGAILNSSVPVVVYVSPSGARAASAGTYILYAAHVAAMAPATHVGAATPVSITGAGVLKPASKDEKDDQQEAAAADAGMNKAINDSVAYIRALAERRGRNADWGEQAVREAVSVSAKQALDLNIIDLIAPDVPALLQALNGREVETRAGPKVLNTQDAVLEYIEPSLRSQFLSVIANPSVALILLLLGLGGLVMEGSNPGAILPGVVGAICLLLALYALQLLPINFAGLGLVLLGVVLLVSEVFVSSYGILAIGGVISLVVGSVIMMRTGSLALGIGLPTIIAIALAGAGIIGGILWLAWRSHRHPVVSGSEQIIGARAEVLQDFQGKGWVHVFGESWQARSDAPLSKGQQVVVTARDGLILTVQASLLPRQDKEQES